jgi:putative endonuclease
MPGPGTPGQHGADRLGKRMPGKHGHGAQGQGSHAEGRVRRGWASWRRGRLAEALCRLSLRLRGYRVLAAGRRSALGEIDIMARRGRVLAAIEVKARPDADSAAAAVSERQRRRIERAARQFVAGRPDLHGLDLRFDVMLVLPWRWPRHLPGAWTPHGP